MIGDFFLLQSFFAHFFQQSFFHFQSVAIADKPTAYPNDAVAWDSDKDGIRVICHTS